jgi:hypothetical protein
MECIMDVWNAFFQGSTLQAISIAVQILALVLILPVILTLALTEKFSAEATTGVLGTIIGFFFGGAQRWRFERKARGGQQGNTSDGD